LAKSEKVSERTTCSFLGITRRTIQNWRSQGYRDKRKGSHRYVPRRLSKEEQDAFYEQATNSRFKDSTPEQIVAILSQEGNYIASASTLYRILRARKANAHRQQTKKPVASLSSRYITVTAPNQVWVWDITWLKTDVRGQFKYGYTIMDLYDRSIVGWSIEDNESDEHSKRLFERIIRDLKVVPQIVHADNGHPMRGVTLAVFLDSLFISRSYSRPRCSNDNAAMESWHKTLKYTVGYPEFFTSLGHARTWYADFVHWYNNEHLHSGLDYVTPMQVRTGEALALYSKRNNTLALAHATHPDRWIKNKVRVYSLPSVKAFYRPINKAAE